jgi:hypothetical protein
MPQVTATNTPILWVVGNPVVAYGTTELGELSISALPMISGESETAFLAAVVAAAPDVSEIDPLPGYGQPCEGGAIYGYNGSLVICRQSHTRTEHTPADIPALFAVYRENAGEALEWVAGEGVLIGTRRLYEGVLYECLQKHQTQVDQAPSAPGILGVLWGVVATTPEWVVGMAYKVGDTVTYQGGTYACLQAHTSIQTWCPTCPGILNVLWRAA